MSANLLAIALRRIINDQNSKIPSSSVALAAHALDQYETQAKNGIDANTLLVSLNFENAVLQKRYADAMEVIAAILSEDPIADTKATRRSMEMIKNYVNEPTNNEEKAA